jgi:serine/threonine protein kinase
MFNPSTINDFLHLLRESKLLEPKLLAARLEELRAGPGLPGEPRELARLLLKQGLLTPYQAEQLLQGSWRGFTIGKYRIKDRLGNGSTGCVYLCDHANMGRRVAVKVLPFASEASPSTVERFRREARALASLDHPNVIHVHDFDQDGEQLYLVMEYVDGVSLHEYVKQLGALEPGAAAHFIRQAALGLQHIHEANLIHRDVKPGNLMLDARGVVKVLDLGLALFLEDENEALTAKYDAKRILGTADYLAPEQAVNSHEVDIRADVYGLGATLYYLLSGRTPYVNGTVVQKLLWVQTREPTPIRELCRELPEGLADVLRKMMARDREERYQTPAAVAAALEPWAKAPDELARVEALARARATTLPEASSLNLAQTPRPSKAILALGIDLPTAAGPQYSTDGAGRLRIDRRPSSSLELPDTTIPVPESEPEKATAPPGDGLQAVLFVATVVGSVVAGVVVAMALSGRRLW